MTREEIVRELANNAEEDLLKWGHCWNMRGDFRYRSYWRTTIFELLKRIKSPNVDIEDELTNFAHQMDSGNGFIFSVSHDAAIWLLDEFLIIRERSKK